jgi:hypothetical protein
MRRVPNHAFLSTVAGALCLSWSLASPAQTAAARQQDESVGASINYVFATDLGSGIYEFDGRTLQIYQLTYEKSLRDATAERAGVYFELPVTFGFFDFKTVDVLTHGLPDRVDSFSVVPGIGLDYLLRDDWHLLPYARAGFSVASSSVNGWLYGAGVRLERRRDFHGWDSLTRSELAYAGAEYRDDVPSDQFLRLRQGFDLTHALGWHLGGDHAADLGLYGIFDVIVDPPTAPVAGGHTHAIQAEFGFTLATRPRYQVWRFNFPRLGFGYRLAGELSSWRFVIGEPF